MKLPLPAKVKVENREGGKYVSILGYTGDAVMVPELDLPFPLVYNMESFQVDDHIPYSYEHRTLMGHTVESEISNGQMTNVAQHTVDSELSNRVYEEISNGEAYRASMDAEFTYGDLLYIDEGTITVNNREFEAPIFVAARGRVTEITATKVPKDQQTLITKLSKHYSEGREALIKVKNSAFLKEFENDADAKPLLETAKQDGWDKEKFEQELLKVKNAKKGGAGTGDEPSPQETPAPAAEPWDGMYLLGYLDDDKVLIQNARTHRWTEEQYKIERENFKPDVTYLLQYLDAPKVLISNAAKEGWDEEKFKEKLEEHQTTLKVQNSLPGLPGIHINEPGDMDQISAVRMAMALNIGEKVLIKNTSEKLVEQASKAGPMYIREGLTMSANANGGRFTGHSDIVNVMKHVKACVKNSSFTTMDFPNLIHLVTQFKKDEVWQMDPSQAPSMCREMTDSTLRKKGHLKAKGGQMWKKPDDRGKLPHQSMGSEDTYTSENDTVGSILTIPRKVIINDDMDMIEDAMILMLEGAWMIPDFQLVNLIYGASGAGVLENGVSSFTLPLTRANLSTVYNAVRRRTTQKEDKGIKGQFRNTKWKLVVGTLLEETAWEIVKQDKIVDGGSATDKTGEKNYWFNRVEPVTFDNLDNTDYHASARSDAWMLLPTNQFYAPFYCRYLDNQKTPITETVDLPADELGFGERGYWDINLGYRPVENGKLQAFGLSIPTT